MHLSFCRTTVIFFFLLSSSYVFAQPEFPLPFTGDAAGSVNGRVISAKDYADMAKNIISESNLVNQKVALTSEQLQQINKEVWNRLIEEMIISGALEKHNLHITDAELMKNLEKEPPASLKLAFSDSMGVFHKDEYISALHDQKNNALVQGFLIMYRKDFLRKALMKKLESDLHITDEEIRLQYMKEKPNTTAAEYEKKKEKYAKQYTEQKKQQYFADWVNNEKAHAKIVDLRKMGGK